MKIDLNCDMGETIGNDELIMLYITSANIACGFPADGYHGGLPGTVGAVVLSNGDHPHPKSRYVIHPRQTVTLRLPDGGGFYSPLERDPARVLEDVKQGYVSLKCAEEKYGVVIDEKRMAVDEERTKEARLKRYRF